MRWLTRILEAEIDPRPLGVARVLAGLAVMLKFFKTAPLVGHALTSDYVSLPYRVSAPPVSNEQVIVVVLGLWGITSVLFMLGLYTRLAGATLAAIMAYVLLIDQQFYSNHHYLILTTVVLLTIANSGARYSLDSWNSDGAGPARVPYWPMLVIKLQLTSVYLFAGLSKLNQAFLEGVAFSAYWRPSVLERWERVASLEALAILTVATELFLAFGFWLARVRWAALITGIGLHVSIVFTLGDAIDTNLIAFGLVMFALYTPFFSDVILRFAPETAAARAAPVSPPA